MHHLKFLAIVASLALASAQGPALPDCDQLAAASFAVRDTINAAASSWAGSVGASVANLANEIDNDLNHALNACHSARGLLSDASSSFQDTEQQNCQLFGC